MLTVASTALPLAAAWRSEVASGNTGSPRKNRVWGFCRRPADRVRRFARQAAKPHRVAKVSGRETASDAPYMRARYYNPRIMRFLNADPIGFAGGLNWYAFADGNPVMNVDPSGWEPQRNGTNSRGSDPGGHVDLGDGMTAVSVNGQVRILNGGKTLGTPVHVALANYRLTGDSSYLEQAKQLAGDGLLSAAAFKLVIQDVFDDTGLRRGAMEAYSMEGPSVAIAATMFFGKFTISNRDFHGSGGVKDDILSAAGPKNYQHLVGTNPDVRVKGNEIILRGTAPGVKGNEYPTGLDARDFFGGN